MKVRTSIPSIRQVEEIVSEVLGTSKLTVRLVEREGGDSCVFKVEAGEGQNYFFRTGGVRSNYDVEHAILKELRKSGIKVPEPVAANVDPDHHPLSFSILRELPGTDLLSARGIDVSKCVRQVGVELAKIHRLTFPGFGSMDVNLFRSKGELGGSFKSWRELITDRFKSRMSIVAEKVEEERRKDFENSSLSKEQVGKVLKIVGATDEILARVEESREKLKISQGRLLHGDLSLLHIIVLDGELVGLIDFNHAYVGDPFFDIAYFSLMTHGDKYYRDLLEGSGLDFDEEKFSLYRLVIAAGKIKTRYVEHNYLHKYPGILDVALEELSK